MNIIEIVNSYIKNIVDHNNNLSYVAGGAVFETFSDRLILFNFHTSGGSFIQFNYPGESISFSDPLLFRKIDEKLSHYD